MFPRLLRAALHGALTLVALGGTAYAQTPIFAEAHTISGGDASVNVAPVENELTVAAAGAYDVTVTDLRVPVALDTVMLSVTSGATVVTTATIAAGATSAVAHFDATPGTYIVHVVGGLTANQTFGSVGILATHSADGSQFAGFKVANGTPVAGFTATLALANSTIPANEHVIDTLITLSDTAQHEVDLTDLQFPQALQALQLILTDPNGSIVAGFPLMAAGSVTFTATPGSYHLVGFGQLATGATGGLYNVRVAGAGAGADVFNETDAVGHVALLGKATLAAGQDTLALTDFGFPAGLAQGSAILTQGPQVIATAAGGPQTFTATGGSYQVFALAIPDTNMGVGSYSVTITPQGGSTAFSTVQTTGAGANGAASFSFPVDIASAGDYSLRLADFQFPQAMKVAMVAAVQNGAVVGTPLNAAGSGKVTLTAGKLLLLVTAQPSTAGKGVMGVDLTPAAGGTTTFAVTQGVGASFGASAVSITAAGNYDVNVADLGFPVSFTDLSAVVTQGATQLGSIYGGGKFSFMAAPGTYFVSFLATPAAIKANSHQTAGTYGVSVAASPLPPTVTFTSSVTQVTSGDTVTLHWSSANASACTASGGWSGTLASAGDQVSAAITATTTFTLTCTGPGGSANKSLTVTATPKSSSGGGGGAVDGLMAALLALAVVVKVSLLRRSSRPPA
jgi:plastocyanin